MKILKTILILTIIISDLVSVFGQELRSLDYNPAIINAIKPGKDVGRELKSATPFKVAGLDQDYFFEDFSDYDASIYPTPARWTDNSAYINCTFADSMISIGVATLDAYDKNGFPYMNSFGHPIPSDTLTSISLFSTTPVGPVFLSFFYEAGGKGDMPEEADSLMLDFYSPKSEWKNVWEIPGGEQQHHFTQVILPIADSFLVNGFRFRFRNFSSLNVDVEDKQTNADQWNLDYIQVKHATDIDSMKNLNDITIMEPLLPSLTEYTTVPYRHLSLAQGGQRQDIPLKIRTMCPDSIGKILMNRTFKSYDLIKNSLLDSLGYQTDLDTSIGIFSYQDYFTYDLPYHHEDSMGILKILSYIGPGSKDIQKRVNDTVRRVEVYYNDYAYDDGSAEFGFGISGENQGSIQIANRFRILSLEPDTLKAVKIYFNKTLNNSTANIAFKICVWKNDGEKPGELIYESSNTYSPDTTKVFGFTRFNLETPVLVSDTIFVGTEQSVTRFINIGYDVNFNSLKNIYVKTSLADWYNPYSLDPAGSLMIRPSFSNYDYPPTAMKDIKIVSAVNVYPNPARDVIYIDNPDGIGSGMMNYTVVNTIGVTLINTFTDSGAINISELNKGLYFLIVTSPDRKHRSTVKFLKY
jgi:hypothetical protein